MDLLLLSFLSSADELERERLLGELVLVHAAPLVRRTLRQRLGFYVDHRGANPHNHEAEDIYHDAITSLITRLNEAKAHPDRHSIRDFRSYVTRLATNACNDYLRIKSPARSRLKNNLRDMLERHQDLSTWKNSVGAVVCGFASWRSEANLQASPDRLRQVEEEQFDELRASILNESNIRLMPLTRLVAGIFNWVEGPIEVDILVRIVAVIQGTKDCPTESLDEADTYRPNRSADTTIRCEDRWVARQMLSLLWSEMLRLPEKQRKTICLSFEDASGDDLFSLLVDSEVVTLPQIAEALNLSLHRLMILWQQMPMDGSAVAVELGVTPQQIYKWRFQALKHLQKHWQMSSTINKSRA